MSQLLEIAIELESEPGSHGIDSRVSASIAWHDSSAETNTSQINSVTSVASERQENSEERSTSRAVVLIVGLAGIQFTASLGNAMVGIGAPTMAKDLGLESGLILWPVSVFYLACSSLLLLAGAVSDVLGHTMMNLAGCFLCGIMTLGCGWVESGIQLIILRAVAGIGFAMCSPTSVAIVTCKFKEGRARNIAFSCLGFSAPLGFSAGLVLGGLLLDGPGWRSGLLLCGSLNMAIFILNLWNSTHDKQITSSAGPSQTMSNKVALLKAQIDWVGASLACSSLAMLSYVLAYLSQDIHNIKTSSSAIILAISILLWPVFVFWQHYRKQLCQPALIPNSIWKNRVFTSVCITVLISYAVSNVMELFSNLFFQQVQGLSPLESSIRIVPSLVVGVFIQIATGLFIDRLSPYYLVIGSILLSAGAPLLMANINPVWPYWYAAFPAQLIAPVSVDIIFTIGLLVVSAAFPRDMQALAGAVFNTVAQFGSSLGLTLMQMISSSVTETSTFGDKRSPAAVYVGLKVSFWTAFASMVFAVVIGIAGMRKMERIGLKKD